MSQVRSLSSPPFYERKCDVKNYSELHRFLLFRYRSLSSAVAGGIALSEIRKARLIRLLWEQKNLSSNLRSPTSFRMVNSAVEGFLYTEEVGSSNLSPSTKFCTYRLSVRTLAFHAGKRGSTPLRCTIFMRV